MRFHVKNATWLSERIRDKIMQMVWFFFLSLSTTGASSFALSVERRAVN